MNLLSNFSQKRNFLSFFILFILLFSLAIGVYLTQQRQEFRKKAAGEVSLTLNASQQQVSPGQTFDVDVRISATNPPSDLYVSTIDFTVTYPQQKLDLTTITPGLFLTSQFNSQTMERLSLGITCQQDLNCRADVSGPREAIKCLDGICKNVTTNIPAPTPGVARVILGVSCKKDGTLCYPQSVAIPPPGVNNLNIAKLTFTVKSNASPGPMTIGFDRNQTKGTATKYASPQTPVNIISTNQLNPITVTIPTQAPQTANLTFKVKFQGINQQRPNKTVKIILTKAGNTIHAEDVGISSDQNGVYTGRIMNITPDTYDIFIKGWAHLQKKFASVTLVEGDNIQDWSATTLKAGDFDNNNNLNITDNAAILSKYTALSVPIDETNRIYDVDSNNVINISDVALVLANYTALEVPGDN